MPTHHSFCRICEALCGLEVDVEENRITDVRPDPEHVATRGFGCLKGLRQHKMYASADRLRHPEKRIGDRWVRATWAEAFEDIGARVRSIRQTHGGDAIAMYVGTAAGFSVLHPVFAQGFMTGLGSRSMYSSATQDCANKFAVSREMYGFPFTLTFPDVRNTECLVVVGANPVVSKWSFLQVPNPTQHLREITARGGKVWVVDPRRTETAKATGEHLFIRPDTDVFFFLSFLHELCELDRRGERRLDRDRLGRFTTGFDRVAEIARAWPPERTAEVTRIPADRLRALVRDYAFAGSAALYSSTGVNMGKNGSLCYWLQEVINAASGNLDRKGGTLVGEGLVDFAAFGKKTGTLLSNHTSRIGQYRAVNDALPGGLLADEILTGGERQVRALFVTGGNPLITMPNAGRLREAFTKLDLLVTLDIYKNETGSLAHWILPATAPFERADLPFIFPLLLGLQSKPYLQATKALIEPDGEQRDEASIYLDLCRASGVSIFGSRIAQHGLEALRFGHTRASKAPRHRLPQELLLDLLLRATRQGSFSSLIDHPHGKLRQEHRPQSFLGERIVTADRKVHLAPERIVAQTGKLESDFELELRERKRLKLITKRAITTHNSWTHNLPEFVEGDRSTNYLYVHPEDAKRLGLSDGAIADVSSDTATVRVPVKVLKDLMPGTVALPHGWGHQHATGLSVASKTGGVNVNLLAADGPNRLEKLSGMAHLTGLPVDVKPAAGPRDPTSWSGMPPG